MRRIGLIVLCGFSLVACASYEVVSGNADEITYKFDPSVTKLAAVAWAAAEHCTMAHDGDSHAYAVDDDMDGKDRVVRFVCRPMPSETLKQLLNQ